MCVWSTGASSLCAPRRLSLASYPPPPEDPPLPQKTPPPPPPPRIIPTQPTWREREGAAWSPAMAAGTISRIRLENFMCHSTRAYTSSSTSTSISSPARTEVRLPNPKPPSLSPIDSGASWRMMPFSSPTTPRRRREERHPHGPLHRLRLPR
jgi:hypothetical protein